MSGFLKRKILACEVSFREMEKISTAVTMSPKSVRVPVDVGNFSVSVGRPCWSTVVVYYGLAAFSKCGNMKNSFPSDTFCSLPDLIWRMSQGRDAWLTLKMTLDIVSCKHPSSADHMVIE